MGDQRGVEGPGATGGLNPGIEGDGTGQGRGKKNNRGSENIKVITTREPTALMRGREMELNGE